MKKLLLLLMISLLGFSSCQQNELADVQDPMADIDLFLIKMNDLNKVIFLSKNRNNDFEQKAQELKTIISKETVTDTEVEKALLSNFGISKDQITELQTLANRVHVKYAEDKEEFESILTERFELLLEKKTISMDYIPYETRNAAIGGLRASCAWIASKTVLQGGLTMAAGCLAGPAGCLISFAIVTISVIDATIELCEKCGCE